MSQAAAHHKPSHHRPQLYLVTPESALVKQRAELDLEIMELRRRELDLYEIIYGREAADELGYLRTKNWPAECDLMDRHAAALAKKGRR